MDKDDSDSRIEDEGIEAEHYFDETTDAYLAEEVSVGEEVVGDSEPGPVAPPPPKPQPALLGLLGLVLLAGLGLVIWGMLSSRSGPGSGPVTVPSAQARLTPIGPLDPKLASLLTDLQAVYVRDGAEAARKFAESRLLIEPDGMIRLTIELDTEDKAAHDEVAAQLDAWGVKIDNRNRMSMDVSFTLQQVGDALAIPTVGVGTPIAIPTALMGGDLPPTILNGMAHLKHVSRVLLATKPDTDSLPLMPPFAVRPEGIDKSHANVWQQQGFTGKGMKIAVLDPDGFYGYKEMLGEELPTDDKVHVMAFNASRNVEGNPEAQPKRRWHGAACAEIVHAMAPDAELYLAAFDTFGSEEKAVEWAISQGVNIISASYGSNYYPTDGKTAATTLLVDKTTRENGIFWAISSGNEADGHYRGVFQAGPDGISNIFYNGQARFKINVLAAGAIKILLRWDDWQERTVDYTFLLLDENGNELAASRDVQSGPPANPVEILQYNAPSTGDYYLAITAPQGTRGVTFDIFIKSGSMDFEKYVAGNSVGSPGDATTALTVGAINWQSEQVTGYSSQGPTDDGRIKPDIAAHSDMTSRTYSRENRVFSGTSASAPLVAGAAALVWSANRNFTADQVKTFLMQRAVDAGDAGPDPAYGAGRLEMGPSPNGNPVPSPEVPSPVPPVTPVPPLQPGTQGGGSSDTTLIVIIGGSMIALALLAGTGIWLLTRRNARLQPAYAISGPGMQYRQHQQYPPQQPPPGYYPGPPPGPGQAPPPPGGMRPPVPPQPAQYSGQPGAVPPPRPPMPGFGQPPAPGQAGPMPPGPRPPMPGVAPGGPPQPQPQGGVQPPAPRPPMPQPQAPGQAMPPQPPTAPMQAGPVPPQPPAVGPGTGPGGRPAPPPPRQSSPCPSCGRMLKPGATQCDHCGWQKS
ncbi:MAG TPA: S8 family serine peptidase [Chloroflexia bacterium]|nr:S8 family serine peptidase [Chloroflexia bacterium]